MPYYEDPAMDRVWKIGERGFTHYDMRWGTVVSEPDDQGWFFVLYDENDEQGSKRSLLNAERFVTSRLASKYGYGSDPKACFCESSLCNGCDKNPCTYAADERFAIRYIGQACTTCVANLCSTGMADAVALLDEDRSTSGVGYPD